MCVYIYIYICILIVGESRHAVDPQWKLCSSSAHLRSGSWWFDNPHKQVVPRSRISRSTLQFSEAHAGEAAAAGARQAPDASPSIPGRV